VVGVWLIFAGMKVLADFASPSVGLRTAMELQQRFAAVLREDSSLPLRVGVGVDVGEAVSVGQGYRGGALNRAARLCSLAQAGEVLLTESVLHLAGRIAGAAYTSRGRVRVKGIAEPLSVRQLCSTSRSPRSHCRRADADGGSGYQQSRFRWRWARPLLRPSCSAVEGALG
jgi:class 3 adenylate cyclase